MPLQYYYQDLTKVQKYSLLYAMLACIIVVQGRAYERVLSAINFSYNCVQFMISDIVANRICSKDMRRLGKVSRPKFLSHI